MSWYGLVRPHMTRHHFTVSFRAQTPTTNHQPAASVLNDRVLGNLGSVEHVEDHSFNSHELAVLSASLDPCVPEAAGRLPSIFKVHELPLTRGISESLVDEAVDTFWEFFSGRQRQRDDTQETAGTACATHAKNDPRRSGSG